MRAKGICMFNFISSTTSIYKRKIYQDGIHVQVHTEALCDVIITVAGLPLEILFTSEKPEYGSYPPFYFIFENSSCEAIYELMGEENQDGVMEKYGLTIDQANELKKYIDSVRPRYDFSTDPDDYWFVICTHDEPLKYAEYLDFAENDGGIIEITPKGEA